MDLFGGGKKKMHVLHDCGFTDIWAARKTLLGMSLSLMKGMGSWVFLFFKEVDEEKWTGGGTG